MTPSSRFTYLMSLGLLAFAGPASANDTGLARQKIIDTATSLTVKTVGHSSTVYKALRRTKESVNNIIGSPWAITLAEGTSRALFTHTGGSFDQKNGNRSGVAMHFKNYLSADNTEYDAKSGNVLARSTRSFNLSNINGEVTVVSGYRHANVMREITYTEKPIGFGISLKTLDNAVSRNGVLSLGPVDSRTTKKWLSFGMFGNLLLSKKRI